MSPLLLKRLSDEELGGRLATGEAAAFDELYRRYVHRLSAYGANLLGDATSGDDVAQSALLKAYGALRAGRVPAHLKPWLFRIAHNAAIDLVRRRRELPSAELPERSAGGGEPAAHSGVLLAALAALPERQRRVYVLRELHGLRIDETGAELGLTSAQVEQALFVARNRMAEHLVFGNRLNCVAVQRLALGPLERDERRALKTHVRSCTACRGTLRLRGRALGLVPVAPLDWLRGVIAGVAGTGAPVAAKVGAVVATASFAAGIPVAADQVFQHPRPIVPREVSPARRSQPTASAGVAARPSLPSPTRLAAAPAPLPVGQAVQSGRHGDDGASDRSVATRSSVESYAGDGQRTRQSPSGTDTRGDRADDGKGSDGSPAPNSTQAKSRTEAAGPSATTDQTTATHSSSNDRADGSGDDPLSD